MRNIALEESAHLRCQDRSCLNGLGRLGLGRLCSDRKQERVRHCEESEQRFNRGQGTDEEREEEERLKIWRRGKMKGFSCLVYLMYN